MSTVALKMPQPFIRKFLVVAATIASALGAGAAAATAAPPSDPFTGTWVSVDVDGSNQELRVQGAGPRRHVRLFDDNVTGGACDPEQGPGRVFGSARVAGSTMTVTYRALVCSTGQVLAPIDVRVESVYDPVTDTLTEVGSGIVWHRA